MILAKLHRFPQRREQSFRIEENSPKTLDCSHYVEYQILQENELKAHLRDTMSIYTGSIATTRMFRYELVNVEDSGI
jgi:hypothetical protein